MSAHTQARAIHFFHSPKYTRTMNRPNGNSKNAPDTMKSWICPIVVWSSIISSLFGAIVLTVLAVMAKRAAVNAKNFVEGVAVVTDAHFEPYAENRQVRYRVYLKLSYTVDNRLYTSTTEYSADTPLKQHQQTSSQSEAEAIVRNAKGTTQKIWFDPKDPAKMANSPNGEEGAFVLMSIFAVILYLMTGLLFYFRKSSILCTWLIISNLFDRG